MKTKFLLLCLLCLGLNVRAQILCIFCYDQNDSISQNVNNFIVNGGFENTNCPFNSNTFSWCPNSSNYYCDIMNWTCTGGGISSYPSFWDSSFWYVQSGTHSPYFGNSFCDACGNGYGDTSCLVTTGCEITGMPNGFPSSLSAFGLWLGVSLEQTVNGLTPGATYVLEFWAGGERVGVNFPLPGLFGLDIGFGYTYLKCNSTSSQSGIGKRYIVIFNATSTSHTIKFTNWGHLCMDCTELVLDDVRLYTLAELSPAVPPCTNTNISAGFSAPNTICPGNCIDFQNLSVNATTYSWSFPGGNPNLSTDVDPTNICYSTPGSYDVTLIAYNGASSDTTTLTGYITVFPSPQPQAIMQSGDTLIANAGAVSYQWYENGNLIPGATDYLYVATESGNYNVVATDTNGCEVEAVIFDVIASTSPLSLEERSGLRLYPNPVSDILEISSLNAGKDLRICIFNNLGEKIFEEHKKNVSENISIDVSSISAGTYFLELSDGKNSMRKIFTKR